MYDNESVRQLMSELGSPAWVAGRLGINRQSVRRYVSGQREIPFSTGWAVLRLAGKKRKEAPDITRVLSDLHATRTLREIGDVLGVDQDTVGCYIAGKRKRIMFDVGMMALKMAGLEK